MLVWKTEGSISETMKARKLCWFLWEGGGSLGGVSWRPLRHQLCPQGGGGPFDRQTTKGLASRYWSPPPNSALQLPRPTGAPPSGTSCLSVPPGHGEANVGKATPARPGGTLKLCKVLAAQQSDSPKGTQCPSEAHVP